MLVVVLCLLVPSAVVGELVSQWEMASAPRERGKSMIIGVPTNLQQETPRYGFAYDLATWLADDRHYSPRTFYSFSDLDGYPDDPRDLLRDGQANMVITPKPVTDHPGADVSFAGPYMVTYGGVLVRGSTAIRTIDDLAGRRVCTWKESTFRAESMRLGQSVPVEKDILSLCVNALVAGDVDAVAGDQILLSGIAKVYGISPLVVVPGVTFGDQQSYGIEMRRDNVAECNAVRDAIRRFITSGAWDDAFRVHMPGVPPAAFRPDPDRLDRCE